MTRPPVKRKLQCTFQQKQLHVQEDNGRCSAVSIPGKDLETLIDGPKY